MVLVRAGCWVLALFHVSQAWRYLLLGGWFDGCIGARNC
jgi:hypothetical protein